MTGALEKHRLRILAAALMAGVLAALSWSTGGQAAGDNVLRVRFGGAQTETRVVIDLDRSVSAQVVSDGASDGRIVIALPRVDANGPQDGRGQGLVRAWSIVSGPGGARLQLELARGATIKRRFLLPPADGLTNYRYVIDLVASGGAIAPTTLARSTPAAPTARTQQAASPRAGRSPRVTPVRGTTPAAPLHIRKIIVIDPGHGGHDPGASGGSSDEKDVNLAAARALKARLERTGRYQVVMTRETDVFVALDTRVQIARRANADLFISLHADSGGDATTRGASVYTLSEQAGSRVSLVLNRNEWFNDASALDADPAVGRILLDLTQRSTRNRSASFAQILLDRISDRVNLLPRSHRDANLFVLLAPEVPAVLLEMGFMTSPEDERALNDGDRRNAFMDAVGDSIDAYFAQDSQLASR